MKIKGHGYESVVDCVSIFSSIIKAITIGDYYKRSLGNIKVHLVTERLSTGPYETIRDHMGPYGTIWDNTGKQAGAKLCQAQGILRIVRSQLDQCFL